MVKTKKIMIKKLTEEELIDIFANNRWNVYELAYDQYCIGVEGYSPREYPDTIIAHIATKGKEGYDNAHFIVKARNKVLWDSKQKKEASCPKSKKKDNLKTQ